MYILNKYVKFSATSDGWWVSRYDSVFFFLLSPFEFKLSLTRADASIQSVKNVLVVLGLCAIECYDM